MKVRKSDLISIAGLAFTVIGWALSTMEDRAYYEEVKNDIEKRILDKITKGEL